MTYPLTGRVVLPVLTPRPRYEPSIRLDSSTLIKYIPGYPRPNGFNRDCAVYGDATWWNECGRKKAHFCLESAQAHASRIRGRAPGLWAGAYQCRWCDWWHVGSSVNNPEPPALPRVQKSQVSILCRTLAKRTMSRASRYLRLST